MNKNTNNAIIVDMDGTLSLMNGIRDPFEYDKVHLDKPNTPIIELMNLLKNNMDLKVIIFSGRMNEIFNSPVRIDNKKYNSTKELTKWWIEKYIGKDTYDLIELRKNQDFRCDSIVKKEMYNKFVKNKYNVKYVIDDRQRVVDMWRDDLDLTTLQVDKGNF